ncbi:PREDICTED: molybdopterin synthase sulfur carrier subunit-like [Branchiostoma belcheri]|uniref:Molybdopterin synthase sulfur carrier subunit n=1 Tax=Branchiostoma belcheri TaxID=7741 RepID=A0A6P4Z232_BRABE|nr:PREDICTED: molybdopterin synthase sulfur carrier subunit-like [Branchiostoma belcheri]
MSKVMAAAEVQVNLLFFAKSRELVGSKEATLAVPGQTTSAQLLAAIVSRYPSLAVISNNLVLAVNQEYVAPGNDLLTLQPGDEVAVIPPISGG